MSPSQTTTASNSTTEIENSKLAAPEPEHCPGPESINAGQGDACKDVLIKKYVHHWHLKDLILILK